MDETYGTYDTDDDTDDDTEDDTNDDTDDGGLENRDRLLAAMWRRWGVAAARANARLLLMRLGVVGRGAVAAEDRRLAQRRRSALLGAAPRLWLRR